MSATDSGRRDASGSRQPGFLRFDEHARSPEEEAAFAPVRGWIRTFVCSVHPHLGRHGDVCPFMTEALLRRLCWIGATEPGRAAVEASLFAAADLLKQPSASADEHQVLRSVIVVPLPGPGGHPISADRIVAIHATLRGRFVAQHLMLGEFFPGCPKPGARSHAIRPLDSPAAFFVVRHMIEPDWRLLQDDPRLLAMHTAAVRRGVLPRSSWDSERG